jgi:aspartate-semialdehyde dehydrogenase
MLKVAVVGATGVAGQQFIVALRNHPWFDIATLAASERSAGKTYREALARGGGLGWYCDEEPPEEVLDMVVEDAATLDPQRFDLIFTAVESDAARVLEPKYAEHTPVVSTASAFRYEEDVPILIPGVNNDHVALIDEQRRRRGWRGFVTPIPNCTTTGLAITLKPLYDEFGVKQVLMTSLQAVSGAGRNPGVLSLDIVDNVIPYIPKEEEKVQRETLKILGRLEEGRIKDAPLVVSCTCTRVNVKDGHTESVFASLGRGVGVEEVKEAFRNYDGGLGDLKLPSAPKRMIVVREDAYRPQPRLDRTVDDGMATVVGRVRPDHALENGVKYVLVSHNTKMGAAKGAVLVAELLRAKGYL